MPIPDSVSLAATTIAIYLVMLWLPGGLAAFAAGARGWTLAASAPLLSYAIAGLAGPYTHWLGLRFDLLSFLASTAIVIALLAGARRLTVHWLGRPAVREDRIWVPRAQWAVAGCVLGAAIVGAAVVLHGLGQFNSIPQDWDAGFHANGMRYIAETGDGSLYGMSQVNWYLLHPGVFYPNAYHLLGALVFEISGADIPATLNTGTLLTPALFALSLVAMIRAFRGRPVVAGYTAVIAVTVSAAMFESMTRGPLLPYQVGIALTPMVVALMVRYLDRPGPDNGMLLGAGAIGLLAVHSSTLFGAILLLLPVFVQRWWWRRRLAGRELLLVLAVALPSMALTIPHLLGAISTRTNLPTHTWPKVFDTEEAIGHLLVMQNAQPYVQWAVAIATWIGILTFWRLRRLAWVIGAAALTGGMYVLVASVSSTTSPWVATFTSPWWNDRFRLITLACVPLCVLAGHGLGQVQQLLSLALGKLTAPHWRVAVPLGLSVVVLAAFVPLARFLYFDENSTIVARGYSHDPNSAKQRKTVTKDEVVAFKKLATMVKPGERVMNDRMDGSLWMYALAGVQPVAGHFDRSLRAPDLTLLTRHFNDYSEDKRVRDAVSRLNIRYVIVDNGYVRRYNMREVGLVDLDDEPYLSKVYSNPDATIYKLTVLPQDFAWYMHTKP